VAGNELRSWKRSQEVGWMFARYVMQLEEKEARSKRCKRESWYRRQFVTENEKEAMQLGMEGSRRI